MKIILLYFACIVTIAFASAVQAADCDVRLNPNDRYQQLAAKLECMNKKIKDLEKMLPSTTVPQKQIAATLPPSGRSFEKGGLTITMVGCRRESQFSNGITCNYRIANKTQSDQDFCIFRGARLVTDKGDAYSLRGSFGVAGSGMDATNEKVCNVVAPLTTIGGWLDFGDVALSVDKSLQFIRLPCGPGCTFDVYDIQVK